MKNLVVLFLTVCMITLVSAQTDFSTSTILNETYHSTLISLINNAQNNIFGGQLLFALNGKKTAEIAEALIRASDRGVEIDLILEGDKKGIAKKNMAAKKYLEDRGIRVTLDSKAKISHAKWFVFDEELVLSGSTNLSDASMTKNNESNILVRSEKIAQSLINYMHILIADCDNNVNVESEFSEGIKLITDRLFFENALELIENAENELCLSTYFFDLNEDYMHTNTGKLFQALIDACKRGVNIQIFLEQSKIDFNLHIHKTNLRTARVLASKGIKGISFDDPAIISHCKMIIADRKKVLMGSTNWYWRGIDQSHQVNFIIMNKLLVESLYEYFISLYMNGEKPFLK